MRLAGHFNAQLMDFIRPSIQPGITTAAIDQLVEQYTLDHGHVPVCLGYANPDSRYSPYPKHCCTSVNDVICHGIPDDSVLCEGDIVNVDITTGVQGWIGDQSETFLIGDVSLVAKAVTQCAFDCLHLAIAALTPKSPISDIASAITREAHDRELSVVREYVGHGVGRQFHQEPSIPHYEERTMFQVPRKRLQPGICFTIEPMINTRRRHTMLDLTDGWTVRTKDGGLSAQFEHTILMAEEGPEILTLTKDGPQAGHQF